MGTTFLEAESISAEKSVDNQGMPIDVNATPKQERPIGIAAGQYHIPDNIDAMNEEIAEMFDAGE